MVRKVTIHTDKKRKLGEATQQILRNIEEFLRMRVGVEAGLEVGVEAGLEAGVEAGFQWGWYRNRYSPAKKKTQGRLELG
jgi:flagellar biosynthesis/type III secretory pathway protein FliH